MSEKKPDRKTVYTMILFIENSRKCKLIYCLGRELGKRKEEWFKKGLRKLFGVMDMFIILSVTVISQVYKYIKTDQTVYIAAAQHIRDTVWCLN